MHIRRLFQILGIGLILCGFWMAAVGRTPPVQAQPTTPVKLIFIHHSSGENWLSDEQGGLAKALQQANYFVSDTNYGWGPEAIGDRTDIVNWPEWFLSAQTETYMAALYAESGVNSPYERILDDPGGENQIVLFKSCFPNSDLSGNPDDPPRQEDGLTVANARFIYNDLLKYFGVHPEKLFVVITAPPLINPGQPENARAFNTWLVRDWLAENNYALSNVAVFDYYNVLTHPDNHHRLVDGRVEYVTSHGNNTLYYDSDGDDHANPQGNRKATAEFVPLLGYFYQNWQANAPAQPDAGQPVESANEAPPEQGQQPDQPEAPASQPGAAITGKVIDDFETAAQAWEAFWQDGSETSISCAPAQDQVFAGSQALKIEFNVQPDTWATCELNLGENQDWSAANGISFAIRASDPAMVVDVLVFGNDPGARVPYVFSLETSPEMAAGWRQVELTWDMLVQPEYEANPGTPLDASKVNGLVFAFNTFPGTPNVGTIWVDELVLSGGEISEALTAPAEQPQDQPDSPGQEATGPPTAAEQQPAAQGGRGLCSAPLFLLGLALWGSGLFQRDRRI